MSYEISLKMAWDELAALATESEYHVVFLSDRHLVRLSEKSILSEPSGNSADEVSSVLVLHYLIGILKCGFHPRGEWISFKETRDGKLFWPAFQKSAIEPLVQIFSHERERLERNLMEDLGGRMAEGGDLAIELAAFPGVMVRLVFWQGEDGLPPEASLLFDRGLTRIYSTEDVAVLLLAVVQKAMG